MSNTNEPQQPLIEFPCEFPIKVMGLTDDGFTIEIIRVIQIHEPTFDATRVEMRGSSAGKYTSLTCTCYVESQVQLDDIYRALTSHPLAKYVL